jgi:hypothetical protein
MEDSDTIYQCMRKGMLLKTATLTLGEVILFTYVQVYAMMLTDTALVIRPLNIQVR